MFNSALPIILVIVVVIVAIGVSVYLTNKRHERSAELAGQRGWTYHKKLNSMSRQVVDDVNGGRSGNGFIGVFEGTIDGQTFYAGTAKWEESSGSGDNRKTDTYSRRVVTRPIPLNAPSMRLEKEGFLRNIFNRDLKTEWEEFNKEWIISGDNPAFVSAVLSPTMQQWLMDNRDYQFVLRPGRVTVYTPEDRRLDYEDIDGLLAASTGFCREIQPFIWKDYGTLR